jgi:hypothetical protein
MSVLRKLLVTIVVSLFAASLALSLSALYQAGIAAKVSIPPAFPWIIDGFIVAMTLVIVEAKRDGRALTIWPRLGLYGVTAVSVTVQGVYAPPGAWDKVLHTLAPVAVLWSFESLVWLVFVTREAPERVEGGQPEALGEPEALAERPVTVLEPVPVTRTEPDEPPTIETVRETHSIEATRTTSRPAPNGPGNGSGNGSKAARIRELAAGGADLDEIVEATGYGRDTVRVTLSRQRREASR